MASKKSAAPAEQTEVRPDNEWSDPVDAPLIPDGFVVKEEGTIVEGVAVSREVGEYGAYYLIRLNKNSQGALKVGDDELEMKEGLIAAFSEINAIKPLEKRMKQGPTAVRIVLNEKKGKVWQAEVRFRSAF